MDTKTCKVCGQELTIDAFPSKMSRGKVWVVPLCKPCYRARGRAYEKKGRATTPFSRPKYPMDYEDSELLPGHVKLYITKSIKFIARYFHNP